MPQKTVDDFYCPTCKSCPLITDYCPNCSRLEGSSGLTFDKVVYLEDQVRVWKENYDELERLAREQIAKLERSANTAWEQVRLADNNLHIVTNALLSIQSHAIGSAYISMVCNDALAKLGADTTGETK